MFDGVVDSEELHTISDELKTMERPGTAKSMRHSMDTSFASLLLLLTHNLVSSGAHQDQVLKVSAAVNDMHAIYKSLMDQYKHT